MLFSLKTSQGAAGSKRQAHLSDTNDWLTRLIITRVDADPIITSVHLIVVSASWPQSCPSLELISNSKSLATFHLRKLAIPAA
jgi:hypothetical protein